MSMIIKLAFFTNNRISIFFAKIGSPKFYKNGSHMIVEKCFITDVRQKTYAKRLQP